MTDVHRTEEQSPIDDMERSIADGLRRGQGQVAGDLTKRELFAAMAMQAMRPNDVYAEPWVIAQMAVKRADALLEALKS